MIQEKYSEIIETLKKGHRYLNKLSEEEIELLKNELNNSTDQDQLKKIFCIIDNTQTRSTEFTSGILKVLNSNLSDELIIFALDASRKHVLEAKFIKGHRLDIEALDTFKKLLEHDNPEIVEWTLRVIDEMGGQGIYFRPVFDKIKPKIALFNSHKKNVKMIIEMLEKRWAPPPARK